MSNPTRKVSLHERWTLCRRNAGHPHPITYILTYPSPTSLPSTSALSERIVDLQKHFPMLYAQVKDDKTTSPYFQCREEAWNPEKILKEKKIDFEVEVDRKESEMIFMKEINKTRKLVWNQDPNWQVTLWTSNESSPAYLAVSIDHIILDGIGGLRLLKALVAESIDDLPFEQLEEIPILEDTLNIKPPLTQLLPIAFSEILVPKLPLSLQSWLKGPTAWPDVNFQKSPLEASWDASLLIIPPSLVDAIKTAGKSNGVSTLHPILKSVFAISLWAVCQPGLPPFSVDSASPKSERSKELGHSNLTGNYISSFGWTLTPTPTQNFWKITLDLSTYLRSASGLSHARGGIGLLQFLPDGLMEGNDPLRPTKWEDYALTKAHSPTPYRKSLEVTNLAYTELPAGASDLVWGVASTPFEPGLTTNMIGTKNGVSVLSAWMDEAALTREKVKDIEKMVIKILERLVDPEWKGETLGELTA